MSMKQDKAKLAERTPPGLGVESTYGDISEVMSEGGTSVGEDSAALTALIDERQQQLSLQQDARINELMKMVQVLAQTVPQLAANQNVGTGEAVASPEAAKSGMSSSGVHSHVAGGTAGVPLPPLAEMLKSFKSDQLYSGQDAENDSKWLEFRGKIVPCLRHRALALLLSDARDLEDVKKDEHFSVAANQLFHDFLSAVTSKTANAVVQTYSEEANGILAWRQLVKMRRSTGPAYFVRQVQALLDDTKKFASLANPLPFFLSARQLLDRVKEYACTSEFLPTGEKFHVARLEAVFVAMVLKSLNPAYVLVRSMYSKNKIPSFQELSDAVCDHFDNVIATSAAATETGAGIVEDRRKQEEQKPTVMLKKVPCPICHMTGHSSKECFVTNEGKREEYLKKNPKRRDAIMKRVQDYQKHGKLPNRAAAVTEAQQDPGVDASGEALYAICELDSVVTCFSEDMPQFISGRTGKDCVGSTSEISLHNYYAVLGGLTSSGGSFPVEVEDQSVSGVCRWRSDASMGGHSTLRRPGKKSHPYQPNKHQFLLNKHKYFPVAPVYESFVYIDTLCTALPGRKLDPTQALWEAGREQHLGPGYQISPRQPWYTSDVQYVHSMFMSGSVEVSDRALKVLEDPHFPAVGRVVCQVKMECAKHLVEEQHGLLQRLIEKEPVMVRGSFEKLQSWVTLLSMVTRDTVKAIEDFWALLGYGYEDEWDFDSSSDGSDDSDHSGYDSEGSSHRGDDSSDPEDYTSGTTPDACVVYGVEQVAFQHAFSSHPLPEHVHALGGSGVSFTTPARIAAGHHAWACHTLSRLGCVPGLSDSSDSDDEDHGSDTMPTLEDASDSDEEDGEHSWQPFEGVGIPSDDWASGLFYHHYGGDSGNSISALDAASDIDSDDDGYASEGIPDLVDASDSDEEDDVCMLQPLEGVGGIPSDDWASGLFCPTRKQHLCHEDTGPRADWYDDAPDLEDGSGSDDDEACDLPGGHPMCTSLALCVASANSKTEVFTSDLPLAAGGGQVAMLDSGASKHIFNSMASFGGDFDTTSRSTFSVVQAGTVSSEGSGTVTFAKLDVFTGRAIGLQFTGAHCIPGQPFNLVSVVALEDAGFSVDFGARRISSEGVTFSFSRVGNQYIIYEDRVTGALDTYVACAAYHDDSDRDKSDWKFEKAGKHIEEHGPFTLELFASSDNHVLGNYCTTDRPCFDRDWAGEACYGNPPYEHDVILKCLQKALSDFDRAPHSTKFLLVLPRWETASWWQFTSQFTIVHKYPAGETIFSAPLDSCYNVENLEMCGEDRVWVRETKWPVVVLYKDGHTAMKLDPKMLAHLRLGHIGDVTMQDMLDEGVPMGITSAQYAKSLVLRCSERCVSCRLTKAIRPSMKPTGRERAEEIGLLVWSDTCGPFRHSAGGYRWFVLFLDDCTSWLCVYFLKKKSDYLGALEEFLVEVRKHRSRMKIEEKYHMVLHTDGDSTMIAGQTQQYCKERGIEQRHGSPYLHENQARVERSHRTVQAMARALLVTSGFGVEVWPLAVRHTVYTLNRTFQKPLHRQSPYYKLYGKHYDLSLLRVFGCLAYAFVDPDSREHKLSDRAKQLRYIGHSEVSSAYLLYDPESGKIVKSGMVRFHEAVDKLGKVVTTWDPSAVAPLSTNFMVTMLDEAYHDTLPSGLEDGILDVGAYLPDESDEILAVLKVKAGDVTCWVSLRDYLDGQPKHMAAVRSAVQTGDLNVDYPLFTEVMADAGREKLEAGIICARAVGPSSFPYCVMLLTNFTHIDLPLGKVHFPPEHTCLAAVVKVCAGDSVDVLPPGVTEPKGVKQAMGAPDANEWMEAIQTELEALITVKQALEMMDKEDVPPGVRLLDMALVLKVKLDKHRQLQKRKARVCVRGNKQEYGVDYFDTFAPCTQLSSVRLVIILALNLSLQVYHMDVETAFLNSTLEEDLYVQLPRGLEYQGRTCAKLLKAVYGLKQAGKEWFETSDAFIMAYDERMRRSDVEPCLYFIRDSDITVIILAYVDDYIVATDSRTWYDSFVAAFNSKYACKDLGVLDLVMGIGVRWGPGVAYLSQSGYISQMIDTYGLKDAKPASLPMSPGCSLAPSDGKDTTIPFRGLLGQLQWIARCSRPDIMAAVSALSRFCASYGPEHFVALKQVVRYLKGTVGYELVLRATSSVPRGLGLACGALPMCIYTDADYAGCKTTRKSTSGIAVYLCGSLLIFSSIMQRCVSLSTTEAEIIAMSEGAREIKYIMNVLNDLVDIRNPVPMYCDNQGAIHLASDYVNNNRSKHIEVRNMYIRELVKSDTAEALYVCSADNTADIFTKPLPLPAFLKHRESLGIMKLQDTTSED
ncbi:hypothetical protein CYMTET_34246 [Cymbomonas tetramitiformis]|uniref:Integrase catalytic domain-containing protein n=1 Tax=Cymbomonas tetramitiformis TaxID=36881 RepID=A0AAE0FBH9_9CHLO|nr:hypothetical protein CYMTET_34246 [Cymbomonas tetramitiformis]